MKKLLIGSHAAKNWFPEFRIPNDKDFATLGNEGVKFEKIKDEKTKDEKIIEYHEIPLLWEFCGESEIATPEILYALKISHSLWDIHWNKTVHDILFFQSKKIQLNDELAEKLIKYWTPIHKEKRINLNKKTEEFFKDSVDRTISHDDLHEIVKYQDRPWYSKLLKYPDKPLLDKNKFDDLSLKEKYQVAREEISVLAIERFIIPRKIENYTAAYSTALKLVVVQLTKGWFPYFIMNNLSELYFPDDNYFRSIKEVLRKVKQSG